ncbi:PIN domain-containing protein [Bacillus cereus group sp. BfR-BA-01489]|uniref:PIN domain-containing protein n=1 Tax=Bacillus cereus group sp. BfR-BA-01489 TaxID=2920358 RepID=UPI001F579019
MIIRAEGIIDIRNDSPREGDVFFVDTNVWFWLTYDRASSGDSKPLVYQITDYPNYIDASLVIGAKMYRSGLSLPEIAHQIERVEREIFNRSNEKDIRTKEFRKNYPAERQKVVEEIEISWEQIKQLGIALENEVINETTTDQALLRLKNEFIDGYDLFLLEFAMGYGIKNIISDDSDLASVPGIYLYTANENVINEAEKQNKLIVR